MTVSGSPRLTPKGSLRVESGRIKVCSGKPIEASGLGVGDREALSSAKRSTNTAGYDEALRSTAA